jgi:hypothetical protein
MKNKNVKSLLLGVGLMVSSVLASGYDVSNKTKPFKLDLGFATIREVYLESILELNV